MSMDNNPTPEQSSGILQTIQQGAKNPLVLIVSGVLLLLLLVVLLFSSDSSQSANDKVLGQAQKSLRQVSNAIKGFRQVLQSPQVQELASAAAIDADKLSSLGEYISGHTAQLTDLKLYGPDLETLRGEEMGSYGYALLDMLFSARKTGLATAQVHGAGKDAYLVMAVRIGTVETPIAYLMVRMKPESLFATFEASLPKPGTFAMDQYNGKFPATLLRFRAQPLKPNEYMVWLPVAGSLFRIGVVQSQSTVSFGGLAEALIFVAGLFLLGMGVIRKFRPLDLLLKSRVAARQSEAASTVPEQSDVVPEDTGWTVDGDRQFQDLTPPSNPVRRVGEGLGKVVLPDLSFKLEMRDRLRNRAQAPVELSRSIFRAYDIRGVVGKSLDADIARQVGQVVGGLGLDQDAGPIVVARDGRHSGKALVAGMIEGITNAGCDVIDIGAVPTGVLYFAAYELGKGSGVMVTGSHNPPDYNGFKVLLGGITQAGDQITDMYDRIQAGNLRVGNGTVRQEDMLKRYRDKISGDIQLQKPLKIVADCGNGIGGICAVDVLRDIGAMVAPLFDEVDGSFPNHHPDPSEPENLKDLLEAVAVMGADLGVAFDGDADRLGVVTPDGQIIYSDRLMMLFARDVLGREPGAPIIYDVKCTNHLHGVIEEAGGKAVMYKTGHSLIKNKMREIGAPFAGEMSGHFFFKERWYGFDCGIYAAARLLEILAADGRSPQAILNSLPNSVSTPELKVRMQEGENHVFVAEMQKKAHFSAAKINTIDGVRADFSDGWGLVRASNTTPVLVLRFDADNEAALQRIKDLFKQQMLAINSRLELPF